MKLSRILVIDDEPEIRKSYHKILSNYDHDDSDDLEDLARDLFEEPEDFSASLLEEHHFEVVTAAQGLEGVGLVKQSVARKSPFSVAFIDMRMPPGMDGLETAKQIIEKDPNIEIVIVTAYADRSRKSISEAIGGHRFFYLKKPFDSDELIQLAEGLTLRWHMTREREVFEEEKRIFISNMSHELRQPLQVILGVCETLRTCEMEASRREAFLLDIETEARRLRQLAEGFRTIQQLEEDTLILPFTNFDMNKAVDNVIRLLGKEAFQKKLYLEHEKGSDSLHVAGDENSLTQVLINLIVNGIHYTKEGGVTVQTQVDGDHVEVSVSDTGVGIPESEQEAIFKKFYRVPQYAIKIRGHGLGLTIAMEVVQAHGSVIEVESTPGEGSRFSFRLPLSK